MKKLIIILLAITGLILTGCEDYHQYGTDDDYLTYNIRECAGGNGGLTSDTIPRID